MTTLAASEMFLTYKIETILSSEKKLTDIRTFSEAIAKCFPNAGKFRETSAGKKETLFRGLSWKSISDQVLRATGFDSTALAEHLPCHFSVLSKTSDEVRCMCTTGVISNGNTIYKIVTFYESFWRLEVGKKEVNLSLHGISSSYNIDKDGINLVCHLVDNLILCQGRRIKGKITDSRYHVIEIISPEGDENTANRYLKSVKCMRVVSVLSRSYICRMCLKMTISNIPKDDRKDKDNLEDNVKTSQRPTADDFRKLIPNASPEMIEFLLSQAINSSVNDLRGRRWSRKIISTCLELYTISPNGYKSLQGCNMFILPSISLLILYKNSITHRIGFHRDIFQWMLKEATRLNVPPSGLVGGVIIDEMSIQEDLQIVKKGTDVQLVGFADTGEEGEILHILKSGKQDKVLGNHVLQFVFLGLTGFRFPLAHFLSIQVQATEIY